jgi:hypothetical protein
LQNSPGPQVTPQPPQFVRSDWLSMQRIAQQDCCAEQKRSLTQKGVPTQAPRAHDCPIGHALPQAPQFPTSPWRFTQTPPQGVCPGAQIATQAPLEQTVPGPHARPQPAGEQQRAVQRAGPRPEGADPAEVMALVLHWLSSGPCQAAVPALAREAAAKGLLPARHDFSGARGSLFQGMGLALRLAAVCR